MIEWIADGSVLEAIQSARAQAGAYHLFVVEMHDAVMTTVSGHVPTISWGIFADPEHNAGLIGSCAPSFEDAKLRPRWRSGSFFASRTIEARTGAASRPLPLLGNATSPCVDTTAKPRIHQSVFFPQARSKPGQNVPGGPS